MRRRGWARRGGGCNRKCGRGKEPRATCVARARAAAGGRGAGAERAAPRDYSSRGGCRESRRVSREPPREWSRGGCQESRCEWWREARAAATKAGRAVRAVASDRGAGVDRAARRGGVSREPPEVKLAERVSREPPREIISRGWMSREPPDVEICRMSDRGRDVESAAASGGERHGLPPQRQAVP